MNDPAARSSGGENRQVFADRSTDLEKQNQELKVTLEARTLERNAAKEELEIFSSAVSHDLRAPLRSVLAYSQLLKESFGDRLDDDQVRLFSRIDSNVGQMRELIEDVLHLSHAGQIPLRREKVPVKELILDARTQLAAEILGREIMWQIEELGTIPADPGLLRQALVNLISNALKFTRDRPVAIIRVHREDEEEHAVFHVTDNGVGFPPEHAHRLFKPFERLSGTHEGHGLGLSIVERIIARHGGRVAAEGRPGQGATFKVFLPKDAS